MKLEEYTQKTYWSCGPAALKILLSAFNHNVSEEQLIQLTGANPQSGTSHEGLIRAAQQLGYEVYSHDNFTPHELARLLYERIPVLVDFQGNSGGHYAVASKLEGHRVTLADPRLYGSREHTLIFDLFIARWYSKEYGDNKITNRWAMFISPKTV